MGLIDIPDPVSIVEGWINGKLEREIAMALLSTLYSGGIAALVAESMNQGKVATWLGLQSVEFAVAESTYLSLIRGPLIKQGLVLSIPKDLLKKLKDPDNQSQYVTVQQGKPSASS